MRWLAALTFLVVSLGCGDDDAGGADGAPADDGASPPGEVDIPWLADGAPTIAPPDFGDCPTGWEPSDEDGVSFCEPFPTAPMDCGPGEAHLPGSPGCAPIGSPCPAGDFADTLPSDRPITYVRAGATSGDGSMAMPWGALTEFSVSRLAVGSVVALGKGRYEEEVRLPTGITMWGACAAETEIATVAPTDLEGAVIVLGADTELRDVRVTSSVRKGVSVLDPDLSVHLAGVELAGNLGMGALVEQGTLTADRLVVRDAIPRPTLAFGRAIWALEGATVDLTRTVVERTRDLAVYVGGGGTGLGLTDSVVRDTRSDPALRFGRAVTVQFGATASISRSAFVGNREVALSIRNADTTATISDVVVRDTAPTELDGRFGRAIEIGDMATATIERAFLERAGDAALAIGDGASGDVSDVFTRDQVGDASDGSDGMGIAFENGTASVTRARLVRARTAALHAVGPSSAISASDLSISELIGRPLDEQYGRGLNVEFGARLEAERVLVDSPLDIGLFVSSDDATLTLRDAAIFDTAGNADGHSGRGANAQGASTLVLERVLFDGAHEHGVIALDGAGIDATDLVVRDVEPAVCAADTCAGAGGGHGLGAYYGSAMTVSRFVVERADLCGVHVAVPDLTLSNGVIRDSTIGACIQAPGFDVTQIMSEVRYDDNETTLQATELPLPDAVEPIPSSL